MRKSAVGIGAAALVGVVGVWSFGHGGGGSSAQHTATTPQRAPAAGSARRAPERPHEPVPRKIDCARLKCVALTFDDGPAKDTSRLLGMLRARNVKATFFLVGQNVATYPKIVKQELADGHELGDHTWDHASLPTLSSARVRMELARTQNAVRRATGMVPTLLRPPYGATNHRVAAIARDYGMPQILWEVDPLDWKDRDSGIVEHRVVGQAAAGDIILMHDIHPTTVSAVPEILDGLAAKGFTFVTVSELFGDRLKPGLPYTRRKAPRSTAAPYNAGPAPARSTGVGH